jgi:fructose-specific phosphotransferase system IIC component
MIPAFLTGCAITAAIALWLTRRLRAEHAALGDAFIERITMGVE